MVAVLSRAGPVTSVGPSLYTKTDARIYVHGMWSEAAYGALHTEDDGGRLGGAGSCTLVKCARHGLLFRKLEEHHTRQK
jgi:hypothetical protein